MLTGESNAPIHSGTRTNGPIFFFAYVYTRRLAARTVSRRVVLRRVPAVAGYETTCRWVLSMVVTTIEGILDALGAGVSSEEVRLAVKGLPIYQRYSVLCSACYKRDEIAVEGHVTAAIFLLKGLRPEKYKDRQAHEVVWDGDPMTLTDSQLAKMRGQYTAALTIVRQQLAAGGETIDFTANESTSPAGKEKEADQQPKEPFQFPE